jgi:hypothetical protein
VGMGESWSVAKGEGEARRLRGGGLGDGQKDVHRTRVRSAGAGEDAGEQVLQIGRRGPKGNDRCDEGFGHWQHGFCLHAGGWASHCQHVHCCEAGEGCTALADVMGDPVFAPEAGGEGRVTLVPPLGVALSRWRAGMKGDSRRARGEALSKAALEMLHSEVAFNQHHGVAQSSVPPLGHPMYLWVR